MAKTYSNLHLWGIFYGYVSHNQRVQSQQIPLNHHKIPWNHHFPMVFLWFSYTLHIPNSIHGVARRDVSNFHGRPGWLWGSCCGLVRTHICYISVTCNTCYIYNYNIYILYIYYIVLYMYYMILHLIYVYYEYNILYQIILYCIVIIVLYYNVYVGSLKFDPYPYLLRHPCDIDTVWKIWQFAKHSWQKFVLVVDN
jgi:hypothetical protein